MKDVGYVSLLVDLYSFQPWSLNTFWSPGLHVLYHKHSGSKQTSYEESWSSNSLISDLLGNEVVRKEGHQRAPHPHAITHAVTLFILLSQGCRRAHERTKSKKWTLSGLRYWSPLTCFPSFCAGGSKALERSAIFCQRKEKELH